MSNQNSNFLKNTGSFVSLALTAYSLYQNGSALYQYFKGSQNENQHSNQHSNSDLKCDLCHEEISSSFFDKIMGKIMNSFYCSICRVYYHQDCFLAKKNNLTSTKRCPKCRSLMNH